MSEKKAKPATPWFVEKLKELDACGEAVQFAQKHRTFPAAWSACDNNAWLWLAGVSSHSQAQMHVRHSPS